MPKKSKEAHPTTLYVKDNGVIKVVPWEEAPEKLQQEYLISFGFIRLLKKGRDPDMGHNKGSRKKYRGGSKFY